MKPESKLPPGTWASQTIAFFGCVVVPALVTVMAPVSYLTLEQREGRVVATAHTCLLFVIPFRSGVVDPVVAIEDRVRQARQKTPEERRRQKSGRATIEGEGTLILIGKNDQELTLTVSPASIDNAKTKAAAFIATPTATPLWMFLPANWKFSVLFGGFWASLTLLYVVGVTIKGFQTLFWILGAGKRAAGLDESAPIGTAFDDTRREE